MPKKKDLGSRHKEKREAFRKSLQWPQGSGQIITIPETPKGSVKPPKKRKTRSI